MDLLVRIARETLPLVHHRFKVDNTGNWYKVAESLIKEKQIYGAIEAISGTGNWPMTQSEFSLWQDHFFMSLAEYCHKDEVISLEWPLIRHNKFRDQLQFIGSLKKVSRANGRRELIDRLIDSPISDKLFSSADVENTVRERERQRLLKLFHEIDQEERDSAGIVSNNYPPVSEAEVREKEDEVHDVQPQGYQLKKEEEVPAMAFSTHTDTQIPTPVKKEEPQSVIPKDLRKTEQEQAYKEAYQIFREGKRYELAGNYLKALDSYYYCRQLLVQSPPARELYGDCMSAIARCTTKLEHKKRMVEADQAARVSRPRQRQSFGYRFFWSTLTLAWVSAVAYGVYVYFGDSIMPYLEKAVEYFALALERLR